MPNEQKQICQIRIVFPVDTDEKAVEYKKAMAAVLAEIPDAQVHFSLMASVNSGTQVQHI